MAQATQVAKLVRRFCIHLKNAPRGEWWTRNFLTVLVKREKTRSTKKIACNDGDLYGV